MRDDTDLRPRRRLVNKGGRVGLRMGVPWPVGLVVLGIFCFVCWYFSFPFLYAFFLYLALLLLSILWVLEDLQIRMVGLEETIRKNADEDIEARKLVRQWLVDKGVLPAGKVDPPTREG
jgi:hypothetical protein